MKNLRRRLVSFGAIILVVIPLLITVEWDTSKEGVQIAAAAGRLELLK